MVSLDCLYVIVECAGLFLILVTTVFRKRNLNVNGYTLSRKNLVISATLLIINSEVDLKTAPKTVEAFSLITVGALVLNKGSTIICTNGYYTCTSVNSTGKNHKWEWTPNP